MVATCASTPLLVVSSQSTPKKEVVYDRHRATFPPSIWGEHFIQYSNNGVLCSRRLQKFQELKTVVRKKLEAVSDKSLQHLKLIETIDRLGLAYHFEDEIEEAIRSMFQRGHSIVGGYDLYHTSLHFRLLRKHGYNVSTDIFNNFLEADGKIKDESLGDIWGLLGLYEAAQLRVHDDVILDQALISSISTLIKSLSTRTKIYVEVKRALKLPLHKDLPRLLARRFISRYGESGSFPDADLLKMAKLDFNLLQQRHQHELSQLTIWWKEKDMASKCDFARDRVVELYTFALVVIPQPEYGLARNLFTKLMCILTIFDDLYDAYGTADELELLTKAVMRWDRSMIDRMPLFMKASYEALLDVYDEVEVCMELAGKSYKTHYARKIMQITLKAYHEQQKWFKNNLHVPSMEEYMRVALDSVAVHLMIIFPMLGMDDDCITEKSFVWVMSMPKMLKACSIMGRLKDDMVSHKFEQERGHPPSSVECYMNQHKVSEQETLKEFNKQVINTWKDMNEACLRPTPVPFKVLEIVLNTARIVEVFYTDGDGITQAQDTMKDEITSLLVNPIPN